MGRLRFGGWRWAVAILSLAMIPGCGGHRPAGQPTFPAKITLTPSSNTSVQTGSTFALSAQAQNANGQNVSATFTFSSNDTSILNVAPGGVACAGIWDAAFTSCTPAGIGVVQVTASSDGSTSAPTYVFVHPPVDNIRVTGILPDNQPIQEPCLSQTQSMTLQAQAFSNGQDVTASVGPFIWSANNPSVVKLTPIVTNNTYNFATNQATATAVVPGMTQIFATASGVSSTSFQQPQLRDSSNNPIPVIFDFFETCPIQNIVLEVGHAGSEQVSFTAAKGGSETVVATLTDVMGNTSLPNSNNGIVLSKIPLTWSASKPSTVQVASGCTNSCAVSTPSPGSGSITASCSPPSCNVGFPQIPASLSTPQQLTTCAQYFPPSCEPYIPVPVYASPLPTPTQICGNALQPPCPAAISGVVTGTPAATPMLVTSLGCASTLPGDCGVGLYDFSTTREPVGSATIIPTPPNSMVFTLTGDKAFMGSNFGAQVINPANLGTANSAFTALGTVTGKALAVSPNGNLALFSDTIHTPNQVYVVNQASAVSTSATPLNISSASAAAFSPDNLKAFIFGLDSNGLPNLFIYSTLQALQTTSPALTPGTTVSSIVFSTNGAFAYVAEPSLGGGGPAVSVYDTCDNQLFTDTITGKQFIPLAAAPVAFRALPDGIHFVALESNGTIEYITATITGIPAATPTQHATSLCSMTVGHTVKTIDLNQGNIHPVNFFVSADGTLLYVLASDLNSIVVYNFATGSVTGGIQLASTPGGVNPTAIAADMTTDASTIVVAGSDGYLHQVSTAVNGSDMIQSPFPNLTNGLNPFCTITPTQGPCVLDFVAVRP